MSTAVEEAFGFQTGNGQFGVQAGEDADGSQRNGEPVSGRTEKLCGGVPMVMLMSSCLRKLATQLWTPTHADKLTCLKMLLYTGISIVGECL